MANQHHVRLFARGVADWNKGRVKNPFDPDLSGASLGGQPPGDPKSPSTFARLAGVNLRFADLRATSLGYSDLKGADLSYANLEGASFIAADMTGANLLGACVRNADLRSANLSYANLEHTDFTGAHLGNTDLSRVITLPASIWNAKLFESSEHSAQPSIKVTQINSVSCLMDNIGRIRAELAENDRLFFSG